MAAVARYRADTDGVNTSSGTNTITLAASRTMTAYAQGDMFTFKAGGTNTGATTLNVDALGAKDVQFNGAACTGGEIVSGLMYTVVYDGTQFQLMNAASYPAIDITTLEVTNIKAKDGTASMTIADSTGAVTAGTLNATTLDTTNIEVTNLKAKDGTASMSIANSTGVVTAGTLNATTVDTTNIEVTNIKAKDGSVSVVVNDTYGQVDFYGGNASLDVPAAQIRSDNNGVLNESPVKNTLRFFDSDGTPVANQVTGRIVFQSSASGGYDEGYIVGAAEGASGGCSIRFGATANGGSVSEIARISSTGFSVNNQISGKYTAVGTNIAAQGLATNKVSSVTISADTTLTTTVPPAGATAYVIIVTSGSVSRTVTFGSGFASTGTLATGATASRRFVVSFVSDGTRLIETARTVAITV
jgi:hypothetical protein